jgi:hypothetical protein
MFNPVFTDPNNALLVDRLNRVSEKLRVLVLSTAEDYQASVYSEVNAVLTLGYAMTPLFPVASEGPAVVGDAQNNFTVLNNDTEDIANEVLRIEDLAASTFNLSATSQNQLRQQIRELIYGSNKRRYVEDFLNSKNLSAFTASFDFNAGLATSTFLDEIILSPVLSSGTNSIGSLDADSSFSNLSDGRVDTSMVWNGSSLELILSFATPQIMNRLKINLDDYDGLEIDTFTTSPDGTLIEDVLVDLGVDRIILDGTAGKFSGDITIDFPPRHTSVAKIVINDLVGLSRIALRALTASKRRYFASGQLTSKPIYYPANTILFTTKQNVFAPLVDISHQISYDGTQFIAIKPGDVITLSSSPFYHRAVLERSSSRFDSGQGLLVQTPLDPVSSPNYSLVSAVTVPLGNGIIERTITINDVIGPIILRETPMPGSLQVQEGAVLLSSSNGDYTFSGKTISFPADVTGITLIYQTTSLGSAALQDREEYYTPLLYEVKFEVV